MKIRKNIAAKAMDAPYNASGFEFHGCPIPFISEGCSANIDDGSDGIGRLFLFERCSETIGACVAMQTEWSRFVDDSIPIREYEYRWSCEFRK